MPKDRDPFSFNFGANAVRKSSGAKKKGSGGKSKGKGQTKAGRSKGGSSFGS